MLEDSFFMGKGDKLIHASQVYCNVLIMRPQLDYFPARKTLPRS